MTKSTVRKSSNKFINLNKSLKITQSLLKNFHKHQISAQNITPASCWFTCQIQDNSHKIF